MTRRDLIQKVLIGGATLLVLPPAVTSCSKDENTGGTTGSKKITIDLNNATYSALNTAGGTAIVQNIIVANTGNNVFIALDSVCTHQGCTIGYNLASNNFPCPCHGSLYSSTGAVLNGPATVALASYPVSRSGDILTISL